MDNNYQREQDRKARLTAARMADGDPEKLKMLLDALALWPGQESKRPGAVFVDAHPLDNAARRARK